MPPFAMLIRVIILRRDDPTSTRHHGQHDDAKVEIGQVNPAIISEARAIKTGPRRYMAWSAMMKNMQLRPPTSYRYCHDMICCFCFVCSF